MVSFHSLTWTAGRPCSMIGVEFTPRLPPACPNSRVEFLPRVLGGRLEIRVEFVPRESRARGVDHRTSPMIPRIGKLHIVAAKVLTKIMHGAKFARPAFFERYASSPDKRLLRLVPYTNPPEVPSQGLDRG